MRTALLAGYLLGCSLCINAAPTTVQPGADGSVVNSGTSNDFNDVWRAWMMFNGFTQDFSGVTAPPGIDWSWLIGGSGPIEIDKVTPPPGFDWSWALNPSTATTTQKAATTDSTTYYIYLWQMWLRAQGYTGDVSLVTPPPNMDWSWLVSAAKSANGGVPDFSTVTGPGGLNYQWIVSQATAAANANGATQTTTVSLQWLWQMWLKSQGYTGDASLVTPPPNMDWSWLMTAYKNSNGGNLDFSSVTAPSGMNYQWIVSQATAAQNAADATQTTTVSLQWLWQMWLKSQGYTGDASLVTPPPNMDWSWLMTAYKNSNGSRPDFSAVTAPSGLNYQWILSHAQNNAPSNGIGTKAPGQAPGGDDQEAGGRSGERESGDDDSNPAEEIGDEGSGNGDNGGAGGNPAPGAPQNDIPQNPNGQNPGDDESEGGGSSEEDTENGKTKAPAQSGNGPAGNNDAEEGSGSAVEDAGNGKTKAPGQGGDAPAGGNDSEEGSGSSEEGDSSSESSEEDSGTGGNGNVGNGGSSETGSGNGDSGNGNPSGSGGSGSTGNGSPSNGGSGSGESAETGNGTNGSPGAEGSGNPHAPGDLGNGNGSGSDEGSPAGTADSESPNGDSGHGNGTAESGDSGNGNNDGAPNGGSGNGNGTSGGSGNPGGSGDSGNGSTTGNGTTVSPGNGTSNGTGSGTISDDDYANDIEAQYRCNRTIQGQKGTFFIRSNIRHFRRTGQDWAKCSILCIAKADCIGIERTDTACYEIGSAEALDAKDGICVASSAPEGCSLVPLYSNGTFLFAQNADDRTMIGYMSTTPNNCGATISIRPLAKQLSGAADRMYTYSSRTAQLVNLGWKDSGNLIGYLWPGGRTGNCNPAPGASKNDTGADADPVLTSDDVSKNATWRCTGIPERQGKTGTFLIESNLRYYRLNNNHVAFCFSYCINNPRCGGVEKTNDSCYEIASSTKLRDSLVFATNATLTSGQVYIRNTICSDLPPVKQLRKAFLQGVTTPYRWGLIPSGFAEGNSGACLASEQPTNCPGLEKLYAFNNGTAITSNQTAYPGSTFIGYFTSIPNYCGATMPVNGWTRASDQGRIYTIPNIAPGWTDTALVTAGWTKAAWVGYFWPGLRTGNCDPPTVAPIAPDPVTGNEPWQCTADRQGLAGDFLIPTPYAYFRLSNTTLTNCEDGCLAKASCVGVERLATGDCYEVAGVDPISSLLVNVASTVVTNGTVRMLVRSRSTTAPPHRWGAKVAGTTAEDAGFCLAASSPANCTGLKKIYAKPDGTVLAVEGANPPADYQLLGYYSSVANQCGATVPVITYSRVTDGDRMYAVIGPADNLIKLGFVKTASWLAYFWPGGAAGNCPV
ncbi:unnamed protein product, partial [Mesorhabditis spiculigera]